MTDQARQAGVEGQGSLSHNPDALKAKVKELSKLSNIEIACARLQVAKDFRIKVDTLEELIAEERAGDVDNIPQTFFQHLEPWPTEVDGIEIADALDANIKRLIVCTDAERHVQVLWTILTHNHDRFDHSPRNRSKSANSGSGKTTPLKILKYTCYKAFLVSNASPATIFRLISKHHPTLLIDEFDTFAEKYPEIWGILNSGFDKDGAYVIRAAMVDGDYEVKPFSTWAPLAIGGLNDDPETLASRSITVNLKKRLQSETIERFTDRTRTELTILGQKIARWSQDNGHRLSEIEPENDFNKDRTMDCWRPLYMIAYCIGGHWVSRVKAAARCLAKDYDNVSEGDELLGAVREAFLDEKKEAGKDTLNPTDLVKYLNALEGQPWAEMNNGKGLSTKKLATIFKRYGISSRRIAATRFYMLADFADAFARNLAPLPADRPEGQLVAMATPDDARVVE